MLRIPEKLSVITSHWLWSMMYTSERSTPSVVLVEAETIKLTNALGGAIAADQVVSKVASASSSPPKSPGSGPFNDNEGIKASDLKHIGKIVHVGPALKEVASSHHREEDAVA